MNKRVPMPRIEDICNPNDSKILNYFFKNRLEIPFLGYVGTIQSQLRIKKLPFADFCYGGSENAESARLKAQLSLVLGTYNIIWTNILDYTKYSEKLFNVEKSRKTKKYQDFVKNQLTQNEFLSMYLFLTDNKNRSCDIEDTLIIINQETKNPQLNVHLEYQRGKILNETHTFERKKSRS
jgi:hypothetical protein